MACLLMMSASISAKVKAPNIEFRDSVLCLVFTYAKRTDTTGLDGSQSYAYTKMQMHTNKRNATLMLVPSMYAIAHGTGRHFISEYYAKITRHNETFTDQRLLHLSTVPHRRNIMSYVITYVTPNVFDENLFQNNILSPFHPANRRFYTYKVTPLAFDKAQVYAYPKVKNTQTVETKAVVNSKTGKVYMVDFEGEYDMTRFFVSIVMGKEGYQSLLPDRCNLKANFRFMGNNITGMLSAYYNLPKLISDSLNNVADTTLMAQVRPVLLNERELLIYDEYFKEKNRRDSLSQVEGAQKKRNFVKDVLWDIVGDNMVNRIQQDFGKENQGYVRLSPILNPLYMGYTRRKGLIYKFDIRSSYSFNDNIQLGVRFRAGYSFKLHQLYFNIPATFNYNRKHEGYLEMTYGSGNRINTNVIARNILNIPKDDDEEIDVQQKNYTEFTDSYFRLTNHWMFTPKWGFEVGVTAHHRKALHPEFYETYGYPSKYRSVAPAVGLIWRPLGPKGVTVTADYERSIKGFLSSNIPYERIELDAKGIFYASRRQLYSARLGAGFYTMRGSHWYFIDYSNFNDNYIPGGWNDDWSGSFELLPSEWYNSSEYYVRSNFTYERPMLFAAWTPLVGRYVEAERFYVNALLVENLHPYTEWGYGFSTRLLSMGIFAGFKNAKFYGIGCKFDFELFRNW